MGGYLNQRIFFAEQHVLFSVLIKLAADCSSSFCVVCLMAVCWLCVAVCVGVMCGIFAKIDMLPKMRVGSVALGFRVVE